MAGHRGDTVNGKVSLEIAGPAIFQLKNRIDETGTMSVEDQETVKETIRSAARTILDRKPT